MAGEATLPRSPSPSPAPDGAAAARTHHHHPLVLSHGPSFTVEPLARDDAAGLAFVRARLEKETAQAFFDLFRCARDPAQGTAFVARVRDISAEENSQAAQSGTLVGILVLNTSRVRTMHIAGISWVSVLFAHRGSHIGSALVQRAEAYARDMGATSVHVPALPFQTSLFNHLGYGSRTARSTALYQLTRVVSKSLGEGGQSSEGGHPRSSSAEEAGGVAAKSPLLPPEKRRKRMRPANPPPTVTDAGPAGPSSPPLSSSYAVPMRATDNALQPPAVMAVEEPLWKRSRQSAAAGPPDDGTRVARRDFSSVHSAHEDGITARELSKQNKAAQWFNYSIPEAPPAYLRGDIFFRMAGPEDRRQWNALMLAACHYNMGGSCMMRVTQEAACRIVAVRTSDRNTVVGLVAMQESGWVSFIACDCEYRAQGLGSFLLFLAMEWARVRQVRTVSLTPLSRKVMDFYQKWAFHAYPADPRRRKASLPASDLIMERKIDPEVFLLPNGKQLKTFVENYDPTGEVADTSPWYYYFYSAPVRKPRGRKKEKVGSSDDEEEKEEELEKTESTLGRGTGRGGRRHGAKTTTPAAAQRAPTPGTEKAPTEADAAADAPTSAADAAPPAYSPSLPHASPPSAPPPPAKRRSTLEAFLSHLSTVAAAQTAPPLPAPPPVHTIVGGPDIAREDAVLVAGGDNCAERGHHSVLHHPPPRASAGHSALRGLLESWKGRVRVHL